MGNQLFQLAATIAHSIRNNDTYIFPPWEEEKFFNLHNCFSNNITNTNVYREPHFHFSNIPYQPNTDLYGFWQSYKYFEDQQDLIRHLLTPINTIGVKQNYCSIHVRRGDYLKLTKEYAQLDMNYYNKAMDIVKSKYYMVFSDDIEWCKQNFIGDQFFFSENREPAEDLGIMASNENFIIGNSSFSWWSAYLGKNKNKIVIAPNQWFGPALAHDTKDLLPPEWIKI